MDPILDAKPYGDHLDQFLLQLKNQIDADSLAVLNPAARQAALDEYLLELNSFYYQSFANSFFPHFKQLIIDDIRDLYHIHQQDADLKRAILASIKQQARLFNQVKNITSLLKGKRHAIESLTLTAQQDSEARSVYLLYIWKDLAQYWTSLLSGLRKLQNFLDDHKMMSALNQYPGHAVVSTLLYSWDPQDAKARRELNSLLAVWQLVLKILAKFLEDPSPGKDSFRLLVSELEKADAGWDNRKSPSRLRAWYRQYIQKPFRLYLETIKLGGAKNDRPLTIQAADQLNEWLQALLYVVETGFTYQDQGSTDLISNPYVLTSIDRNYLQELAVYSAQLLKTTDESTQGLAASTRADYGNYSRRCSQVLSASGQYLRQQLDEKVKSRAVVEVKALEHLKNQLDLLENRLELLNEREDYAGQLHGQYLVLLDSLDSYLELLQSIQDGLVRTLSPRNLKRSFADMDLHIEHLAIATGAAFPSAHLYLLEEGLIQSEPAPGPEGRVLSEAGDIFIIRLDELEEREIPPIIIAKKG